MKEFNERARKLNKTSNTAEAAKKIAVIKDVVKSQITDFNKRTLKLNPSAQKIRWALYLWPINLLSIDTYQRNPVNVSRITGHFDYNKIDVICVSIRDDKAFIIDGSTRVQALLDKGYTEVYAKTFIDLTEQEEAKIFSMQDCGKRRVNAICKYEADIIAGETYAIDIHDYLVKHGLTTDFIARKPVRNNILAITKLITAYNRYGIDGVNTIISLIFKAGWDKYDSGFSSTNLDIGLALLRCDSYNHKSKVPFTTVCGDMKDKNPAEWFAIAQKKFPGNSGKHGEGCIYNYVRALIGEIPMPK